MPGDPNDDERARELEKLLEEAEETTSSEQAEIDAAASEAAGIGGEMAENEKTADPARRPLVEAGEGDQEGFDQAEADLIDIASHGDMHRFPDGISRTRERATDVEYGEPDQEIKEDGPDT